MKNVKSSEIAVNRSSTRVAMRQCKSLSTKLCNFSAATLFLTGKRGNDWHAIALCPISIPKQTAINRLIKTNPILLLNQRWIDLLRTAPIRNQLRSREIENCVKIVSEIFSCVSERETKFDDLSAGTFCRDRSFLNTCVLLRTVEITSHFDS